MPGEGDSPQLIRVIGDMVDEAAKASETPPASPGRHPYATSGVGGSRGGSPSGGAAEADDGPGTYYVYVDGSGTEHIVDSRALVPKKFRKSAKKWVMDEEGPAGPIEGQISDGLSTLAETVAAPVAPPSARDEGFSLHLPSLLIGLIIGAVLFIGSMLLRKKANLLVKAVLAIVVAAILSLAYLGWVRRQAGLGDEAVAQPSAVLDDARRAADNLQRRNQDQQRRLDQLEDKPEQPVFR